MPIMRKEDQSREVSIILDRILLIFLFVASTPPFVCGLYADDL